MNHVPQKTLYDEVASQHDKIDDFRAKLLGFLPIVTGIGLFALLKDDALSKDVGFFPAIGLFGALSSIGLFVHELRGITECYMLIEIGKVLEHKLAKPTEGKTPPGTFSGRSWWRVMSRGSSLCFHGLVSRETAALIIYPASIAAWVCVAAWPYLGQFSLPLSLLPLARISHRLGADNTSGQILELFSAAY
jgi:hypothetical protein